MRFASPRASAAAVLFAGAVAACAAVGAGARSEADLEAWRVEVHLDVEVGELRVTAGADEAFVTALPRAPGGPGRYRARASALSDDPWSAVGPLVVQRVDAAGWDLELARPRTLLPTRDAELTAWARSAGEAVAAWLGATPPPRVLLRLRAAGDRGVGMATTRGVGGVVVDLPVGPATRARAGQLSPEALWAELSGRMPEGLPRAGSRTRCAARWTRSGR